MSVLYGNKSSLVWKYFNYKIIHDSLIVNNKEELLLYLLTKPNKSIKELIEIKDNHLYCTLMYKKDDSIFEFIGKIKGETIVSENKLFGSETEIEKNFKTESGDYLYNIPINETPRGKAILKLNKFLLK